MAWKKQKQGQTENPLGRLTALGPKAPWQVALLLPRTWDDFRQVVTDLRPQALAPYMGETVVVRGRLAAPPDVHYQPMPRTQAHVMDATGAPLSFTIFGNTKEVTQALNDNRDNLCLHGRMDRFRDCLQLANAQIVHPAWAGRLRPRYPGKPSVIGADTVRTRVMTHLRAALPQAQSYIINQLAAGDAALVQAWIEYIADTPVTLRQLLISAHTPRTPESGYKAQQILEQLNALAVARMARQQSQARGKAGWICSHADTTSRVQKLPFEPSADQAQAIAEIIADLATNTPMHRLLTGDVGTGKTAVYGVAMAVAADAGARVAVLAPNTGLAEQIAANLASWWPDLDIVGVTGATSKKVKLKAHTILVGTTALLHRATGPLDFVVVDEQHKFSRGQREKLLGSGCHLLEATATCTPRAQALTELGIDATSRLKNRPVNNRVVKTQLWQADQRQELMTAIAANVDAGEQVLVIYPERGEKDAQAELEDARRQAAQAFALWQKHFPGQVQVTHGGLSAQEKAQALEAMRNRQASVLVSTTVVEVGIDLPGLMRVAVIHADRLGLVTLHQIRGRVARAGGTGHCDLFVAEDKATAGTPAADRLKVLCETDDGFEVARCDMRLRGFGDLSSKSDAEKGFLDGLLFQRPVTPAGIETAIRVLDTEGIKGTEKNAATGGEDAVIA